MLKMPRNLSKDTRAAKGVHGFVKVHHILTTVGAEERRYSIDVACTMAQNSDALNGWPCRRFRLKSSSEVYCKSWLTNDTIAL